jgi:hypothetical protein
VSQYGVGQVCLSSKAGDLQRSIEKIAAMEIPLAKFDGLRNDLMGLRQLNELQNALLEGSTGGKAP